MSSLVEDFDAMHGVYEDFCNQLEILLKRILKTRGVSVHSISSRVKERKSFIKKINNKGRAYEKLGDVTDLAGIRIITYFSDQVDEISNVVTEEFLIDEENSIDKRTNLDPDRFGYLSVHHIVSLPEMRCTLTENRSFSGLKAEIQIRSILQHAWAEIEHDLGYKTKGEIPSIIRRQFARLAGLLEIGDSEFVKIRNDLDHYEESISNEIEHNPQVVLIDKITLLNFAKNEKIVKELDSAIAKSYGYQLKKGAPDISGDVERLDYFGIRTIAQLKNDLIKYKSKIIELSKLWGSEPDEFSGEDPFLTKGISIYYLCHILAGATQDVAKAQDYYDKFNIGSPYPKDVSAAQQVVDLTRTP